MRVLYAFHGDDWGAIQRAKILIPLLRQSFIVDLLQYGQNQNLNFYEPIKFLIPKRKNAVVFRKIGITFSIPTNDYLAVVTDNEPNSAWSALIHATPCVQIKTPSTLIHQRNSNFLKRIWVKVIKEHYCPANELIDLNLALTEKAEKRILKTLTNEYTELENQNHYSVYLPDFDDKVILRVLFQFDIEWQVFTKSNYSYRIQNVWFRPFESNSFEKSIKTASGVICDLNFQVCSSVLSTRTKLLIIPSKFQKIDYQFVQNVKTLNIPMLDSLDLVHYRSIRNWIEKKSSYEFELVSNNEEIYVRITQFIVNNNKALTDSTPILG